MVIDNPYHGKFASTFLLIVFIAFISNAQPTATLSTDSSNPTNDNPITIYTDFSEDVTGLEVSDFDIVNGTIINSIESYFGDFTFGSSGTGNGEFNRPRKLCVGLSGQIYVIDYSNNRIQIFDKEGSFISAFGESGYSPGQFITPRGIAVDDIENIYVISSYDRVEKFDNNGNLLHNYGESIHGSESGEFKFPSGIALDSDMNVYVADAGNARIQVFDNSGNYLRMFGQAGSNANEFYGSIYDIKIDESDNIYILSYGQGSNRIQVFDVNGNYLYKIDGLSQSSQVIHIDQVGNIYSTNSYDGLIEKRDNNGVLLQQFGTAGTIINEIKNPYGLALDKTGRIVTSNRVQNNIVVFEQNLYDYKIEVQPTSEGEINIQLPSNSAVDVALNGNLISNELVLEYDVMSPSVIVSTTHPSPTDQYPFIVNFEFSEPISSFTENDITIEEYAQINITGSGDTYQAEIWPQGNNTYNIGIAENQVTDLAGNFNAASNEVVIDFSTTTPEVTLSTLENSPSASDEIIIDVTFTEPVTDLTSDDFSIYNATIIDFCCTETDEVDFIQFTITPNSEDMVVVYLKELSVFNSGGNYAPESNHVELISDREFPTVLIESDVSSTNVNPTLLTAVFSEKVYGFTLDDIIVDGGSVVSFTSIDEMQYEFEIESSADGDVQVNIPEHVAIDQIGNGNLVSNIYTFRYDTSPPNIELSTTNKLFDSYPIPITIQFDEAIDASTFSISDFSIYGVSVTNLSYSGDNQYTAELTPWNGYDEVNAKVSINESLVTDLLGYGNTASNELRFTYDKNPMTVVISSDQGNLSNQEVFDINITFSESIAGFTTSAGLTIINGSVVSFSGSGTEYVAQIQSNVDEDLIEIYLSELVGWNSNGIGNPSAQYFVWVDSSRPDLTITSPISDPTSENIIPISIEIDDPVFDFNVDPIGCFIFNNWCFTADDIEIEGGTITNFKGEFGVYTMDVIPIDRFIEISVPADRAFNVTDLGNLHSEIYYIEYLDGKTVVGLNGNIDMDEPIKHWIDKNSSLNIMLSDGNTSANLKMIDLSGKTVIETSVESQHWERSLRDIHAGIYLMLVATKDNILKSKIHVPHNK